MKAKTATIATLLALMFAVGGWLFYSHRPNNDVSQAQATPSASAPRESASSSTPANQVEVANLEKALNSADGQTQLDALAPSMREAYKAAGKDRFLPAGSTAKLKSDSFEANDLFATVDATFTSPDNTSGDFVLLLTRQDANSTWAIIDFKQK